MLNHLYFSNAFKAANVHQIILEMIRINVYYKEIVNFFEARKELLRMEGL